MRIDTKEMYKFNYDDESDSDSCLECSKGTCLKIAFAGIWSVIRLGGKVPEHRVGHLTVYSKELHMCFIGYWKIAKNKYSNDVWVLNVDTLKWAKLKLQGDKITPSFQLQH